MQERFGVLVNDVNVRARAVNNHRGESFVNCSNKSKMERSWHAALTKLTVRFRVNLGAHGNKC